MDERIPSFARLVCLIYAMARVDIISIHALDPQTETWHLVPCLTYTTDCMHILGICLICGFNDNCLFLCSYLNRKA